MGKLSKLITLFAVAGGAAALASYYKQYQEFHKDLDEEFHDFEDDAETGAGEPAGDEPEPVEKSAPDRSYTSLNASKEEFTEAAKDTFEAAKGMANSAKEMLKDVGQIIAGNMRDGSAAAEDTAKSTVDRFRAAVQDVTEKLKKAPEAAEEVQENAEAAAEEVQESAAEAVEEVQESTAEAAKKAAETLGEAEEKLAEAVEEAKEEIKEEKPQATTIEEEA